MIFEKKVVKLTFKGEHMQVFDLNTRKIDPRYIF